MFIAIFQKLQDIKIITLEWKKKRKKTTFICTSPSNKRIRKSAGKLLNSTYLSKWYETAHYQCIWVSCWNRTWTHACNNELWPICHISIDIFDIHMSHHQYQSVSISIEILKNILIRNYTHWIIDMLRNRIKMFKQTCDFLSIKLQKLNSYQL